MSIFATVSLELNRHRVGKYSNYKVVLKDLEVGATAYTFELDNSFFKLINDEESEIKRGKFIVELKVTKSVAAFELLFDIKGAVQVPCDRCLDDVSMEVDSKQKLIVKFGAEYSEESDEIVIVPEEEGEINVAWFIYEFIVLSLPMKHVHPAGQCNKVVASKFKKHKSTLPNEDGDEDDDYEDDTDEGESDTGNDPRWDALKDLETE